MPPPAALKRADHLCFGVDDLDAAIAWYVDKLGFEEEVRWGLDGMPGVELAYLRGLGFRIELISGGGGPRAPQAASFADQMGLRGFNHLCFWSDDIDATMRSLAERGVPAFLAAQDFPVGPNVRIAFIRDLEGNVIEFCGPLAAAAS